MPSGLATWERMEAAIWQQVHLARREREAAEPADYRRGALVIADELGIALDDWQRQMVTGPRRDILVNVTRQGGKGMGATILTLDQILNRPGSKTLVISRAERQAKRLFRRIRRAYHRLSDVPRAIADTTTELELTNGSIVLALPGSEATIRGEDAVDLVIVDEASRVPDDLIAAVRPMLATTDGKMIALTTPFGELGWFYEAWTGEDPEWERIEVWGKDIPRIKSDFLAKERRRLGPLLYAQEYECRFLPTVNQFFARDLIESLVSSDVAPLFGGDEPSWAKDLLAGMPAL